MPFRFCCTKTGMSYLYLWKSKYFSKPDTQKSRRNRRKWWRLLRKRSTWTLRISGLEPIIGHKFCPTYLEISLCKREETGEKQGKIQDFAKKNKNHVSKLFQVLKPFLKCKFSPIWPIITLPDSFLKKKTWIFPIFSWFWPFQPDLHGDAKKTPFVNNLAKIAC